MRLTKYNPITPAWGFDKVFDNFFNHSISDFIGSDVLMSNPSVNIMESEGEYRIELAAPGLEKEAFEITMEKGFLNIAAERKEETEEKEDGKYTRREFNFASFKRSFQLPEGVEENAIKANYDNGVLVITLPKSEKAEAELKRVIDVK
jgi:HSP20 family protein